MSFDPCEDCSPTSGWPGAIGVALMWLVPTVLFVLRRQGVRSLHPELLLAARAISFAAAAVITLIWIAEMDGDAPMPTGYGPMLIQEVAGGTLALVSYLAPSGEGAKSDERTALRRPGS